MKNSVTLEEIEIIKSSAEDKIKRIIDAVELSTRCDVIGVNFYTVDDEEDYKVNLDIRIKHRQELKEESDIEDD